MVHKSYWICAIRAHILAPIRLTTYLLEKNFERGGIDRTLFINRSKDELLVAQIYIDDIIFGATSRDLALSFVYQEMKTEFETSMVGELTFFLRLQIRQLKDGIFLSQYKYVRKLFNKFGLASTKHSKTSWALPLSLARMHMENMLIKSFIEVRYDAYYNS